MGKVYVMSDVHGDWEKYSAAMEIPSEDDTVIMLGDAIDRGYNGVQILLDFFSRPNTVMVMGNHEWFLYNYLRDPKNKKNIKTWTDPRNGGAITKKSVDKLSLEERVGLLSDLKNSYVCTTVQMGDITYRLAHGAPTCSNDILKVGDLGEDELKTIVWCTPLKADEMSVILRYTYWKDDSRRYVVGHVPVQRLRGVEQEAPVILHNIIAIDGGMAYQDKFSKLFLLCLDTLEVDVF